MACNKGKYWAHKDLILIHMWQAQLTSHSVEMVESNTGWSPSKSNQARKRTKGHPHSLMKSSALKSPDFCLNSDSDYF